MKYKSLKHIVKNMAYHNTLKDAQNITDMVDYYVEYWEKFTRQNVGGFCIV